MIERHDLVFEPARAEVVSKVEFVRGPLSDADRRAVEFLDRLDVGVPSNLEALAVVVVDGGEVQADSGVAAQGPGGSPSKHVDLAALESCEPVLARKRDQLDLFRIIEDRRRERAAEVRVESGQVPPRVQI